MRQCGDAFWPKDGRRRACGPGICLTVCLQLGLPAACRCALGHRSGDRHVPRLVVGKDRRRSGHGHDQGAGRQRAAAGDVTVAVEYSTVNYKDGLCLSPSGGGLVRTYPHVAGIDFAGTVEASDDPRYRARRQGGADRLARGRGALGRLCRTRRGSRPTGWCRCLRG